MATVNLTAQRLRELLDYDPESDQWTRRSTGKVLNARDENGYLRCRLGGRIKYRMHRLVWLWHTGRLPTMHIDHIDGDPTNNRITNLREASRSTNAQNQRRPHSNSRLGVQGVKPFREKFQSRINLNGKRIHLGTFATVAEARAAYVEAKRRLHPGCTI